MRGKVGQVVFFASEVRGSFVSRGLKSSLINDPSHAAMGLNLSR